MFDKNFNRGAEDGIYTREKNPNILINIIKKEREINENENYFDGIEFEWHVISFFVERI